MKRIIAALLAGAMLLSTVALLPSCGNDDDAKSTQIALVKDGAVNYTVIRPASAFRTSDLAQASTKLRNHLKNYAEAVDSSTDNSEIGEKEILLGDTNREESRQVISELAVNEFAIKVVGSKIVICSPSDIGTIAAIDYFIENYLPADAETVELAPDLYVKQTIELDFSYSTVHNMTYKEMGDLVLKAFTNQHYRNGNLQNTEVWDAAEILEAYIDAYEQTGTEKYLDYVKAIAAVKFGANNPNSQAADWCGTKGTNHYNGFNDDIAWICIGFARIYHLTGEQKYLDLSKKNFDKMWARAYSPDELGGGLWWHDNQKNTKNSCIQCPASIAACLIAEGTGDDSYYEKAKELMEWEFENLFEPDTGKVYDAYKTDGEKSTWSSTYNQGTFVGACTLLHKKYGDQKYLDYAAKAVNFGMNNLDNVNGVLSGESGTDNQDLPGFKGILTRWFYRYAEYTNDLDVLTWLQLNADTAFGNRDAKYRIWTNWAEPTDPNFNYDIWGLSAAMALLFNCEPWWD